MALGAEPLTSDETSNITTLAHGVPSSPPSNLEPVAVDSERITVTWDPPPFPNGPIVSYSLTIRNADSFNENPDPSFQVKLENYLPSFTLCKSAIHSGLVTHL